MVNIFVPNTQNIKGSSPEKNKTVNIIEIQKDKEDRFKIIIKKIFILKRATVMNLIFFSPSMEHYFYKWYSKNLFL